MIKKNLLLLVTILLLLFGINVFLKIDNSLANAQQTDAFYGTWIINNLLAYSDVSCYSENDIKKLMNKKLIYSRECANFDNHVLKNPKYQINTLSENEFFKMYSLSLEKLGVKKKSIVEVGVYTDDNFNEPWFSTKNASTGSVFLIKDPETLILVDGGVYFTLRRSKTDVLSTQTNTDNIKKVIISYEDNFCKAVNQNSFSCIEKFLLPESDFYKTQKQLTATLHKRGIKEELKEYQIENIIEKNGYFEFYVYEKVDIKYPSDLKPATKEYYWIYNVQQYKNTKQCEFEYRISAIKKWNKN